MKAYLVTTGTIFGLMAVVHLLRIADEWPHFGDDAWFAGTVIGVIVIGGAMSAWAFTLLGRLGKGPGSK